MSSLAKSPFNKPKADPGDILLDYEKLADLADAFEPLEFPRMLLMAELNVVALLDQLHRSIECEEMRTAGNFVHTLGGLLGTYGMKSAARFGFQIELDIETINTTRLEEFVVVVNKSLDTYRAYRCSDEHTVSTYAISA